MTVLASSADLIDSSYDPADIESALSWATSVIEGYCDRTFGLVTGDVVTITPRNRGGVLPEYPVKQVTLVEAYLPSQDGQGMAWQAITNYWLVAETGDLYDTTGLPGTFVHGPRSWPWMPGSLRVTYDHGFDPIPTDLRDVCARLAGQYLENPRLMIERRVGDMEARFSGSNGSVFSALDLAVLSKYEKVGVG